MYWVERIQWDAKRGKLRTFREELGDLSMASLLYYSVELGAIHGEAYWAVPKEAAADLKAVVAVGLYERIQGVWRLIQWRAMELKSPMELSTWANYAGSHVGVPVQYDNGKWLMEVLREHVAGWKEFTEERRKLTLNLSIAPAAAREKGVAAEPITVSGEWVVSADTAKSIQEFLKCRIMLDDNQRRS